MEKVDVMCCYECDNALVMISGRGSYCLHCKFTPSMQDTYIQKDWFKNRVPKECGHLHPGPHDRDCLAYMSGD